MTTHASHRSVGLAMAILALGAVVLAGACGDDDTAASDPPTGPATTVVAQALAEDRAPEPQWSEEIPPIPDEVGARLRGTRAIAAQASGLSERPPAQESVTYRGTMTIDVAYYGFDCSQWPTIVDTDLHHLGDRTYSMPVEVIRSPPAGAGSLRESSPFNLIIGTGIEEGGIQIQSATVVADPEDDELVLFEFWKITESDGEVEGTLVDGWRAAGFGPIANTFSTSRLLVYCSPSLGYTPQTSYPIVEGAELSGTMTDESVDLTLLGQTLDGERAFRARIEAVGSDAPGDGSSETAPGSPSPGTQD